MKLIKKGEIAPPTLKELGINANGTMKDIIETEVPMTCGVFDMNSPGGFTYDYTFDEFKVVLDGEIEITDETGTKFLGRAGDIFHFQPGDKVTFDTPTSGKTFYVSHRKKM